MHETIGVLSPLVGGFYHGALISGIAEAAAEGGLNVLAIQTGPSSTELPAAHARRHVAGWGRISGCIVVNHAELGAYENEVRNAGKPVISISRPIPGLDCPIVQPDNRAGTREAVLHLVGHGHRRIAFVGVFEEHDFRERRDAYIEALAESGIAFDPALVYGTNRVTGRSALDYKPGIEAARRMLADGLRSTAIIAGDDEHALGIIDVLSAAGVQVPRDQAVIGFDDIEIAAFSSPPLSTVRQNFKIVGRQAGRLLLDKIAGRPVSDAAHVVSASFVPRQSCGCSGEASDDFTDNSAPTTAARRQAGLVRRLDGVLRHAVNTMARDRVVHQMSKILSTAMENAVSNDSPRPDAAVRAAAKALYKCDGRADTVHGLVHAIHRYVVELLGSSDAPTAATAARLTAVEVSFTLGLTSARATDQFSESSHLQRALATQYEVAAELLNGDVHDPSSLHWLETTPIEAACLALWSPEHQSGARPDAAMDLVSIYTRGDNQSVKLPLRMGVDASEFPPAELLAIADLHPGAIVMVLPVRSQTVDRGLIAVVGPVDSEVTSAHTGINQWSTLLAVALDDRDNVGSLKQAYARERALSDDLQRSAERYALAAEAASGGLWDWDIDSGQVYYSPRWKAMLQGAHDVAPDISEWFERVHPDDAARLRHVIDEHLLGAGAELEVEHRVRGQNGSYLWVLCRAIVVRDSDARAVRVVGSLTDVHEKRLLEEQLRHDALYDDLTGLPNRTLFVDRLRQTMARASRRTSYNFAVLFLDLDGFKLVNDSLGHLAGDSLLARVAERISADLRPSDTAARFGGDEFAILLDNFGASFNPAKVAERILATLAKPLTVDGHEITVTASIGIASNMTGYTSADAVLRDADTAMYRAKSDGKGTHATFDSEMHRMAVARLCVETELRHAIAAGQLVVQYQPIVEVGTGRLVAFESLMRWEHPSRGLLMPAEFLNLAEETGLIIPMGRLMMRTGCRQLRSWRARGASQRLRIAMNLSHCEFWDSGLAVDLASLVAESGLVPQDIILELTETVVMHNAETAGALLAKLHGSGFAVHLDDFGTGYSSLQALHRFPIEALKMDSSFLSGAGADRRSAELIKTIATMAKNLHVDVIAQGIETEDERRCVERLGCAYGQGHLFGRPMSVEDASRYAMAIDPAPVRAVLA